MKNNSVNKYIYAYIEDYISVNEFNSQLKEEGNFPAFPIQGLFKNTLYTNGSYFEFYNIRLNSEEDFTLDFWFYTNDNSWSRIFDWNRGNNDTFFLYSTNAGYYHFNSSRIEAVYNRGLWNHFALSYNSIDRISKVYINGKLLGRLGAIPSVNPRCYMGKSAYTQDPNIYAYYTGIRIKNECLFTEPFDYLDIGKLHYKNIYSSKILNNMKHEDLV